MAPLFHRAAINTTLSTTTVKFLFKNIHRILNVKSGNNVSRLKTLKRFWATVCKKVSPYATGPLSVCLCVLSCQ